MTQHQIHSKPGGLNEHTTPHVGYYNIRDILGAVLIRLNKVYNNTLFTLLKTSDDKEYFHFSLFCNIPRLAGFKPRPYWYDFSTFIGRIYLNDVLNGVTTGIRLSGDCEDLTIIKSLRGFAYVDIDESRYNKLIDLVCNQVLIRYNEYVVDELIGGTYLKELDIRKVVDKSKYVELFNHLFYTSRTLSDVSIQVSRELNYRTQEEVEAVVIKYSDSRHVIYLTDDQGERIDNWTIVAKIIDELGSMIAKDNSE